MTIVTSGNVGIGTTSPSSPLTVAGTIESLAVSTTEGGDLRLRAATGKSYRYTIDNFSDSLRFIRQDESSGGNGQVRMFINSDGDVGIGTISPSTKMHIAESGTSTALTVENASSNGTVVKLTSTGDNRSLYLQTDHIYSNGALYIGDGSYNTIVRGNELLVETNVRTQGHLYLNYDNTATDSYVYFGDSASDTGHYLKFEHGNQRFFIPDALRLNNYLHASGSLITNQNLYLNYDNTADDAYIYFGDQSSDTAHWLRFDESAQQFGFTNRVVASNGRLGAIESNGSDVDKVNFQLSGTTLTITTS